MADKSINPQEPAIQRALDLLSETVIAYGHSLSWYTSKKGRIWVTLKGFEPTIYTTSIELEPTATPDEMAECFAVLLMSHWPKLTQEEPPLNTWLVMRLVQDKRGQAVEWLKTASHRASLSEVPRIGPGTMTRHDHLQEPGGTLPD